ncbi:transposon Ty3-I Gag-Pol polyprotein [Trichonephila clavipes]|nr:transposon Ty3-I Gag-Pol polyprotein [Trichonephila clavipes]
MAPRTIDAAGVQKDSLRVDELLSKLVSLEEQLASLKLQRKVPELYPHHHQRVEVAANQGAATIPRKILLLPFPIREEVPPCPAANILGRKFRLFVKDRETGCQFLVDSGADVSILPWTKKKKLKTPISRPFIIAKVKRGIIGADFLQKFQLLIDLHNRKLIDGVTNLSIKGEVATIQENNDLSTVNRSSKYFNLLKSYPDLTKSNLVNRVVKHEVKHHILTTGQPVYSKARQIAP